MWIARQVRKLLEGPQGKDELEPPPVVLEKIAEINKQRQQAYDSAVKEGKMVEPVVPERARAGTTP